MAHEHRYEEAPTAETEYATNRNPASPPVTTNIAKSEWFPLAWKIELLAWATSCVFTIGIIVLLTQLNGKSLPDLQFGITPNAIITILSTIAKGCLLLPVQSAMGQLKWIQAVQAGPLDSFRIYDEASRGPKGSLEMLVRRKGGITSSLGAIITVVSLGIATFFQQSLKYKPTEVPLHSASGPSMPVAQSLLAADGSTSLKSDPTKDLLSAINQGFSNDAGASFTPSAVRSCSTSHCVWDTYYTLGVCNTCKDLKPTMSKMTEFDVDDNSYDTDWWVLDNDFSLRGVMPGRTDGSILDSQWTNSLLNITTTRNQKNDIQQGEGENLEYWKSIAFEDSGSAILSTFAIGNAPGTSPSQPDWYAAEKPRSTGPGFADPIAFECILQFCVLTMHAESVNGTLTETIKGTWKNDSIKSTGYGLAVNSDFRLNPPFDSSVPYEIYGQWWNNLADEVSNLLTGSVSHADANEMWKGGEQDPKPSSDNMGLIYSKWNQDAGAFPSMMDNIAGSLTLGLRKLYDNNQPTVGGTTYVSTSRAVVTWEWLILPLFELVASLVFLITVMMQTRRRGLHPWTNNPLAYFFHGLDERLVGVSGLEKEMKVKARNVTVEFERLSAGGRLMVVGAEEAKDR